MNRFNLYGFLNMCGFIPDFVYPIYNCDGALYRQVGEKNELTDIVELNKELYDMVIPKESYKVLYADQQNSTINIYSMPMHAFQKSKDTIIYGEEWILTRCLVKIDYNDVILQEQIEDFINNSGVYKCRRIRYGGTNRYFYVAVVSRDGITVKISGHLRTGLILINGVSIDRYFTPQQRKSILFISLIQYAKSCKMGFNICVLGGIKDQQVGVIRDGIMYYSKNLPINPSTEKPMSGGKFVAKRLERECSYRVHKIKN